MPLWLRIAFLILIFAWSIYGGIRYEDRVLRRLIAAARKRAGRALLVVTACFLGIVGVLFVFGLLAAIAYRASPAASVIVLLLGLALTAPSLLILAFSGGEGGGTAATSYRDLRRLRASKPVARAIAYSGALYSLFLILPAMLGTAAAVVLIR